MSGPRFESTYTALKNLTDELSRTLPFRELFRKLPRFRIPQFSWPALRIGNLVAPVPVVQGGMGVGISLSGLASAVAESGGIGVIAANAIGMIEKDYFRDGRAANVRALRSEIRAARSRTRGILGVNIMVAVNDFHELLDVAVEEKVDLVIMGAGLPIKDIPVEKIRTNGVKVVPIVSSARAAELIFRMWDKTYHDVPDAVVFEGPLAGGHLGFTEEQLDDPEFRLETIVPRIVDSLKPYEAKYGRAIPVIAAGGVFTGEDVYDAIRLGASAVQMATRFVATDECDADEKFKQAYVDCTEDQIGIIKSPVGMPGRAIRNGFIEATEAGQRPAFSCAWQCLSSCKAQDAHYCISIALNNARQGRLSQGFVFAGANAHRVERIVPVASLITELAEGFRMKAKEVVAGSLEGLVTQIGDLRLQYEHLTHRARELEPAYELTLSARIREARDAGVDQMKIRYDSMISQIRDLQDRIGDRLKKCWALLGQDGATHA
jgi:nitronate monooxygenase